MEIHSEDAYERLFGHLSVEKGPGSTSAPSGHVVEALPERLPQNLDAA
ncbi:hypothetical protein KIPB_010718, partial [Kipferlia bialata]|eukprot:g10718.t1